MEAWWRHHDKVDLGEHSRAQVEDYTGRMPLLLDGCTETGTLNLSSKEFMTAIDVLSPG